MRRQLRTSEASTTRKKTRTSASRIAAFPFSSGTTVLAKAMTVKKPVKPIAPPAAAAGDRVVGERHAEHRPQPFTPPAVRPETICRWKTSTRMTSGMVTMVPAAMMAV